MQVLHNSVDKSSSQYIFFINLANPGHMMVTSPVRATVTLQQRHQDEEDSSNEEVNDVKLLRVTIQNNDNLEDNGKINISLSYL